MNLSWLHGPIANVFTCFNEDGSFDEEGQRGFLDFLLESSDSISAYFVRSGMGQMYSYSYEDVRAMTRVACDHLAGKGPVLVGTTGIWDRNFDSLVDEDTYIQQALELTAYAEEMGAAGTVHTMPEAIALAEGDSPEAVTMRYFSALSAAATKPVLIYQPPMTIKPYHVTIDLVRELAALPNVAGMKLSTNDAQYILNITWALKDSDFGYIAGAETAYYAALCSGAQAVIGQGCCVNPSILKAIQDRFENRDYAGAIDAQRSTNLLCERSVPAVEFLKRYAAEKGHKVQPYGRPAGNNPYMQDPAPLTDEGYAGYKELLESELARYA